MSGEERATPRRHRSPGELDDRVLAILRRARRPLTARQIARRSGTGRAGVSVSQVYRVLARLHRAATVHRIELLKAFIAGSRPGHGFLVCRQCRTARPFEAAAFHEAATAFARNRRFAASTAVIEVPGICGSCASP